MRQRGIKRTQIYLYPKEEMLLNSLKDQTGSSRAEVIREAIREYAKKKGFRQQSVAKFFEELSRGTEKMNIPPDLSERHDYYLYGEGSKEFK